MRAPFVLVMAALALPVWAQTRAVPEARVDFQAFKELVLRVEAHRAERLVDLETFLRMSREPGTIILDTRSDGRFDRVHLRGAKHLSFTEFTQENLQKVIPSFETRILIYCNNNFEGNPVDFATKVALPRPRPRGEVARQLGAQQKPLTLALNIPTYLNLVGYGYEHVYELNELVNVRDPRVVFEGTMVSGAR